MSTRMQMTANMPEDKEKKMSAHARRTSLALLIALGLALAARAEAPRRVPAAANAVVTNAAGPLQADWPAWRGDGSGSASCGAPMVDSLDQAKLAWQSDPVGLSGCMYPTGVPGEGWCDPIIAEGRVFVYWFRRAGPDLVDLHCLPASRGWASLIDPPENPEAFAPGGGHRTSLPSKVMSALQRHIRADDIITCLDDRTGKKLWERVFPARGINNVRVYGALCVPCVRDGRVYAIGSSMRVYALDAATGKTIWQSDIGERTEQFDQAMEVFARSRHRGSDIGTAADTSVVCADGVVAIGESASPVAAGREISVGMVGLDAATGRRLWNVPGCLDRLGSPAVWRHAGKEYFLAAGDRMVLVEPRTGKVLWHIGGPDDRITDGCAPAVSGDYAVVAKNVAKTVGAREAAWWRGPSCYRLSVEGAKLVWALPMVEGISLIAPSIMGKHAYVCVTGGVAAVELETGKTVGERLPGFGSAYAGYAVGDGLIFRLGKIGKAFPEMKTMEGALPGNPDYGEIHAPAVANGRVYWRGKHSVWCYDFRRDPPPASAVDLPTARDLSSLKDNPAQLAAVIEKEGWPTRAAAAEMLRLLGEKGKTVAPAIQKALLGSVDARDWGDVDLLIEVLRACDASALKPAAPALAKLLEQKDQLTLRLAFHALALLGPRAAEAVPGLTKHLDPAQPEHAALAARTLCQIGPGAQTAVPALLKCLEAKDEDLTRQAAKALCHLMPADAAARAAAIDAVLAHPGLYSKIGWGAAPPRRNSYKAILLSLLGKEAVPQMLVRAKGIIEMGARPYRKGEPAAKVNYSNVCDLADAAFAIDPKSAPDFLPLLARIPRRNPPVMDAMLLTMTEKDLNGTFDQRDPYGRFKTNEETAKDKKAPPSEMKDE